MPERLNLHIDESGSQDLSEKNYLIGVVLHEHNVDILTPIKAYEKRLSQANLADVPFHGKDLLHGDYCINFATPFHTALPHRSTAG